jgi:hypothetical protein
MRRVVALVVGMMPALVVFAQDKPPGAPAERFNVPSNIETYPQGSPKQVMGSVLKAIDRKRIDYLLAHLAEPSFVEEKVRQFGGRFEELVRETTIHFGEEMTAMRDFRRILNEGTAEGTGATVRVTHKDIKGRAVFLRQIGGRWFIENRWESGEIPKEGVKVPPKPDTKEDDKDKSNE